MIALYAFSTLAGAMSWIALLAGGAEPNLLRKLVVGLVFTMLGIVGIVYEIWRTI